MIEVQDINISFSTEKGVNNVLNDFSFHVEKGEIVTLLGKSGCGKSTLLQIVGGFLQPDDGYVLVNGERVEEPNRNCFTLFQQNNLLPWRNIIDNVRFGLRESKAHALQKAKEALAFVGLEKYEHHYPHEISGGMQQRVAIARAFALAPSVMLMDEPFAALDTFNRYYLQEELLRLQRKKELTIILVTHDLEEAIYLSDRIVILRANPGKIYDIIEISLPKPRDRSSESFHHYRKQILHTFQLSSEEERLEFYI